MQACDDALKAGTKTACLKFADSRPQGRQALNLMMSYLAQTFAARSSEEVQKFGTGALWAKRYSIVTNANRQLSKNGSPALVLEAMMSALQEEI